MSQCGKPVLVLDFDGVISDSARESFAVAVRTYSLLRPNSNLPSRLSRVGSEIYESVYKNFLQIMPLGNRAEDYAVALIAIESERLISSQSSYDEFYAAQDSDFLGSFHRKLYEERRHWRERDPEGWCNLVGPYSSLVDLIRRRGNEVILAIATAKDRGSIEMLLERYSLTSYFDRDLVCDKEYGRNKCKHLQHIRNRLDVSFANITFVDDKLNHLEAVSDLGVRCVLAAWGYNGLREQKAAENRGFTVVDLQGVESKLFPLPT